jgi:hypothetical protein
MNAKWEDDGLSWAGDDDPTLDVGTEKRSEGETTGATSRESSAAPSTVPDAAESRQAESLQAESRQAESRQAESRQAVGSIALLATGILIGVYLLYTIGWFIGVSRIENPLSETVARFMFSLSLGLTVAAPALWFATVSLLTRGRARARFSWLLVGVVVLAPLPFILEAGAL